MIFKALTPREKYFKKVKVSALRGQKTRHKSKVQQGKIIGYVSYAMNLISAEHKNRAWRKIVAFFGCGVRAGAAQKGRYLTFGVMVLSEVTALLRQSRKIRFKDRGIVIIKKIMFIITHIIK